MERDSSDLSQESDTHQNIKKGDEGCLEKAVDPKMERLRTENNLQLSEDDINSTNEIQESGKSIDETFYSWTENDTTENTPRNEALNLLPPSLSITFLTETFPKTSSFGKSTEYMVRNSSKQHSLTSIQENLQEVKAKLECLQNGLLADESKEDNAKSKKSSNASFNDDETLNSSEYEQCESIIQTSSTSLSVQSYPNIFNIHREVLLHNPNYNRADITDSSSEETSKLESSSSGSTNSFTKIEFKSRENLSELNSELALKYYKTNLNIDRVTTSYNQNYIPDHKMENSPMDTSDDQISRSSSQIEFSTDENSDNQSTSALLQEALQFKDALLSQLELEKDLKSSQKTVNEDQGYDFRKNPWTKIDNYFQTKILDIISEEQSASSSTEKTSKTFVMRQLEENKISDQKENSKSALGSTSSEYLSFSTLSQKESENSRESAIVSEKENKNESQVEVPLPNNKRGLDSEIKPDDLVKRLKYTTHEEEKESLLSSKLITNLEEKVNKEEEEIREDEKEIEKQEFNHSEPDSRFQKTEDRNSNAISRRFDSSSDESLTQFITELVSDKAKAANISRESNINLNSTKSENESSTIKDAEKAESTFTLQRRPGSFSLAESQCKEKSVETFDSASHSDFESSNSEVELELSTNCPLPKCTSGEIESDLVIQMKDEDIDINKNKDSVNSENIEPNFDLKDPELNPRSVKTVTDETYENFEEDIKREKDQELIQISKAKCEEELQELLENKSEYFLKEEISENLDSEEKVDKSQSNLSSEPSSTLYFTAEPSSSDIKLTSRYLNSSTSISKSNLEIQETIFEDLNESVPENKICENDCINIEEPKVSEVMLIDLSDMVPGEKSATKTPETYRKTSKTENSKPENLNILDEDFTGKIKEHSCLIPNKINQKNESENNLDVNETRSCVDSKYQNLLSLSGISIFEESNNKFPHCSSAPSLQRLPWNVNKHLTIQRSSDVRSNRKPEVVEKLKILPKRPSSRENSKENPANREKLNKNSNKEKQTTMKTNLNLNLGKQSGDQNQRRSRSFVSPRLKQKSPENSAGIKSARNLMEVDQQIKITSKTSTKSLESQKSSRSCIPVLKTRLENIRKAEHKSRTRSPTRGPLTISPRNDDRDLKDTREFNTRRDSKVETNGNEKSFGDNTDTARILLKDVCTEPTEKTVIYVNIMTDQYQSQRKVVDPKKFLEYVKSRDLKIQNIISNDKSEDSKPKIVTVLSSVVEDDLRMRNLKSKFSFQVEQQEREVSAKPSVMDNSTSVSDFSEFCDDGKGKSKFRIFQVPEELTKEEYIDLLDSLNQDPNFEQLRKMHNLCSKLGVGFQE